VSASEESVLVTSTIDLARPFYIIAWIVCVAGVIGLFFYPLQGIGLILFAVFLLFHAIGSISAATTRALNARLTGIAANLDEMQRKDSART